MLDKNKYDLYVFDIRELRKDRDDGDIFVIEYWNGKTLKIKIENSYKLLVKLFTEYDLTRLGCSTIDEFIKIINEKGFYTFMRKILIGKKFIMVNDLKEDSLKFVMGYPKGLIGITGLNENNKPLAKCEEELFNKFESDQNYNEKE